MNLFTGGPGHLSQVVLTSGSVDNGSSSHSQSSETSALPATVSRPKGPPPPLPKTRASASPKSVQKTPSMTKPPPPLPKTPPKGSVKKAPRKSSVDLPNSLNSSEETHDSEVDNKNENTLPGDIKSAHTECVNDSNICDHEDSNNDNSDKSKANITDIKSRFENRTVDSNVGSSAPKVPLKPKPRPSEKIKDKNEDSGFLTDGIKESEINSGNSKWFVNTDKTNFEEYERQIESETVSSNQEIQIISGKQESIKYRKVSTPPISPKVPRKPLPKPPPKHKLFHSSENLNSFKDNVTCKGDNDSGTFKFSEQKEKTLSNNDLSKTEENSVSKPATKLPAPVPRKPSLTACPRPVPRKRVSLSTSSADKETVNDKKGSNVDLSEIPGDVKCDSQKVKNSDSGSVCADREKTSKTADSGTATVAKRRIVTTATGEEEEYKVIDRSSVRSGTHITELGNDQNGDDNGVILRNKVVRDSHFDIQDVPSVDELKSIFRDSDDLGEMDDAGPDTCLSGDFGFGDKFLTFASKDKENGLKKSPKSSKKSPKENSDDFDDLMKDDSILEPSSLLNEIEDILTRSFKHSSLTRSGSSPEKKTSPYIKVPDLYRSERSKSVDNCESTPVRPPRPKKEQRRLRSMSQISYDSCGSDTESLPDMCRTRLDSQSSNISMTFGKARPHPPKPKRHKLLKVQRSQSDVTAMKSLVEKLDTSISPKNRPHNSNGPNNKACEIDGEQVSPNVGAKTRAENLKKRPTRKAPPPPLKVTPPSPSVDLNQVVPVDERVKSMNLSQQNDSEKRDSKRLSAGPLYHSIKDEEAYSSEGDHDYQDIPDTQGHVPAKPKSGKHASPPKLPPRNLSNSHSFDTSSLSSAGHELGVASSMEDMSISSAGFDTDINLSGVKHHSLQNYPKTSSPFVKGRDHGRGDTGLNSRQGTSNLSLSSSGGEKNLRPVSGCSVQSDSWSGSQGAGQSTSSESEEEDEEKVRFVSPFIHF